MSTLGHRARHSANRPVSTSKVISPGLSNEKSSINQHNSKAKHFAFVVLWLSGKRT